MYSLIKIPKPKPYSINTRSDSAPMTKPTSLKFYILNYHHKSSNKPTHRSNLTIYQQTPSISFRVSNGGEEKLKKKKKEKEKKRKKKKRENARFLTISLRAISFSL